jgi:hypothetical protein
MTYSLGMWNKRPPCLNPVLTPSTQMNLLSELHYRISKATIVYYNNVRTIYISDILFNIDTLRTLRWIYILCVKLLIVTYKYYIFIQVTKLMTFSRRNFRCNSLKIFKIVSTFINIPFWLHDYNIFDILFYRLALSLPLSVCVMCVMIDVMLSHTNQVKKNVRIINKYIFFYCDSCERRGCKSCETMQIFMWKYSLW